jgi:predicted dehydrogenase
MKSSTPLRCIYVGVKNRGSYILDLGIAQPERFQPVALVDATREIAQDEAARRGWQAMPCFSSLEEALGCVSAEACFITSPARFHGAQMRAALEGGLHVFVAKPMTYDLDEAVQLVEMAEQRGLCLVVDQQQQFSPTERTLAEWVREQRFGEVGFASFIIHRYRPNMASFIGADPFLWEQGVHSFNSLIALLDRPAVSVIAHQIKPKWSVYNGDTVSMGVIEFAGGVPCHYLGTFDSRAFTMEIRLDMEEAAARIVAENSWHKRLEVALPGKAFEPTGIEDTSDSLPWEKHNLENFYHGCRHGGRVTNDGRDNLRTLAIVDAFIRASRSGRREAVRQF